MRVVDHLPDLRKALLALSSNRVLVGVPAAEAYRRPEPGQPSDPINNAGLAYIHDNGAPGANIPARPFMRPGITTVQPQINTRFSMAAKLALDGKTADVDRALHAVGLMVSSAIKMKITVGPFAPLAPRTLSARRRKGRLSEKPLIDTAQMRNSITYVIRPAPGRNNAP